MRLARALACALVTLIATHTIAETPADLDGYCAKTYGAGATGGFDRRDNGPLCTERTDQGLGLLHHMVDPSDVCRTQHGMARYRQEGPKIVCLADDESPDPDRKVDLAEYCKSNYGASTIVSRRLTDNQPLCTVKGDGGLSQTHYAIDLDALCGHPASLTAVEGDTLDCGAASRQARGGGGGEGGGPQAGGAPPSPDAPPDGGPPNVPGGAPAEAPILSLAELAEVDLSDCGFPADDQIYESADGRGGYGWYYGGIDKPCSQLGTGLKVDLGASCSRMHPGSPLQWRDGGRPVCYSGVELEFFDLNWACIDAFPGGQEAFYASGLMGPVIKFSDRSLECFYVDIHGGSPSEPDELVEAET